MGRFYCYVCKCRRTGRTIVVSPLPSRRTELRKHLIISESAIQSLFERKAAKMTICEDHAPSYVRKNGGAVLQTSLEPEPKSSRHIEGLSQLPITQILDKDAYDFMKERFTTNLNAQLTVDGKAYRKITQEEQNEILTNAHLTRQQPPQLAKIKYYAPTTSTSSSSGGAVCHLRNIKPLNIGLNNYQKVKTEVEEAEEYVSVVDVKEEPVHSTSPKAESDEGLLHSPQNGKTPKINEPPRFPTPRLLEETTGPGLLPAQQMRIRNYAYQLIGILEKPGADKGEIRQKLGQILTCMTK